MGGGPHPVFVVPLKLELKSVLDVQSGTVCLESKACKSKLSTVKEERGRKKKKIGSCITLKENDILSYECNNL